MSSPETNQREKHIIGDVLNLAANAGESFSEETEPTTKMVTTKVKIAIPDPINRSRKRALVFACEVVRTETGEIVSGRVDSSVNQGRKIVDRPEIITFFPDSLPIANAKVVDHEDAQMHLFRFEKRLNTARHNANLRRTSSDRPIPVRPGPVPRTKR